MTDGLNDAPGLLGFKILADPTQPRVRALQVETTGGDIFTVAFDGRNAMALATTLVSAALAIDPTLKENFKEHINKSEDMNCSPTSPGKTVVVRSLRSTHWPALFCWYDAK